MEGQVELFAKARAFLEQNGMARNVRIADVVAPLDSAFTGTINAKQSLAASYGNAGGFAGPLDDSGNMPSTSMGIIIGSAVLMPRRWVATEEDGIEECFQQLAQDTSHVVKVGGTDVIQKHTSFSARFASVGGTGVYTGPLYGINDASPDLKRSPEPLLTVKPGERVEQSLYVRRATALGAETVTPELALLMVIADQGND